jgi:hypothetical protein
VDVLAVSRLTTGVFGVNAKTGFWLAGMFYFF